MTIGPRQLDLLEPASDWTNHPFHERLRASLSVLYIHGYLAPAEYRRQTARLARDTEAARAERVRRAGQ